jgi:uncharacterized membrane protein
MDHVHAQVPPTGSVISISTDQPCVDTPDTTLATAGMFCDEATILQLGIEPGNSNVTEALTYTFVSIPATKGEGRTDFQGSGNVVYDCLNSDSPSKQCQAALNEGQNILEVQLVLSPVVARYQLESTGLTIPSAYYYNTTSFAYNNFRQGFDQCRVADVQPSQTQVPGGSTCSMDPDAVQTYFASLFNEGAGREIEDMVFSQDVLSSDCFQPQTVKSQANRQNYFPPTQKTVTDSDGSTSTNTIYQYPQTSTIDGPAGWPYYWIDDIYRRWFVGMLGVGGEAIPGTDIPADDGVCTESDHLSACPCIAPIDSSNLKRATTAVCPGGNVKNGYGLRSDGHKDLLMSTACTSGACAGLDDAQCPFVQKFAYGSSRCLGSKNTAEFLIDNSDPPSCGPNSKCESSSSINDDDDGQCVGECTSDESVCMGVQTTGITLDEVIDQKTCYCTLRGAKCGRGATQFAYPTFNHLYNQPSGTGVKDLVTNDVDKMRKRNQWNRLKLCSNYNNRATQDDDVEQKIWSNVCCRTSQFESTTPILEFGEKNTKFYSCGTSSGDSGVRAQNCVSSQINFSPCQCACQSAWQDIAIPVEPLCTVYKIINPAVPMFNLTAVVTYANGTSVQTTEEISVGTDLPNAAQNGSAALKTAVTPDGRVKLSLLNIDKPRGDTLPRLQGYVVICGDRANDFGPGTDVTNINGAFTLTTFVGSPSVTGTTNPWKVALDTNEMEVDGRMPIPSTWGQMEAVGALDGIARNYLGRGSTFVSNQQEQGAPYKGQPSWWYYVPPERTRQYGQGCNQNGWNNFGHYDMASASKMCSGRTGTCVPGYDLRGSENLTETLLKPGVQVPAFVGRQMSNYEVKWAENTPKPEQDVTTIPIPEYVPPGWNPRLPNYWVHENFLFTDADQQGQPAFGSGDIRIRVSLAVAGQLLSAVGSLSAGQLYYSDGVTQAPESEPESTVNDNLQSCYIGLSQQRGFLNFVVKNTGSTTATYSVRANCTNDVVATSQPTNVGVAPGDGGEGFSISLEATNSEVLNTTTPVCEVTLLAGDIANAVLYRLNFLCKVTQNVNYGVGSNHLGNAPQLSPSDIGEGGGSGGQPSFCDSARWLCDFDIFGGIEGWGESLLMWLFYIAILIVAVLVIYGFIQRMNEAAYEKVENMRAARDVARISAANAEDKVRSMRRMMPEKEIGRLDNDIAARTSALREAN